ncbi:hypothetical protein CTAYLR_007902 [Chrysophaeum taylorii]|uniref:EndoU domain-containing protein n=1 Tax=Chrysophaeum taylorii TaxID=2483200 RepID=A0AAD7UMV6_9STRA|nr:hypothetical protein CTAYLR_007902 [Chrysophaeum taylorii]
MASWAQVASGGSNGGSWAAVAAKHEENDESSLEASVVEDETVVEPTREELGDLRLGLGRVWELGEKLRPGVDYQLDLQGYATRRGKDYARRPLFSFVREDVLSRPTFAAFLRLLDNYEREVGKKERVTKSEKAEESAFLDAVLKTAPMRYCHEYCVAKRVAPASRSGFKRLLGSLWFRIYASRRGGPPDSSGFEHWAVGEERGDKHEVVGLHNWLQLFVEERKGALNYHGYVSHDKRRPDEDQPVLSLQFTWTDVDDGSVDLKPTSTSIIGSSPELELALFTLAALAAGKDDPKTTRVDDGREITPVTLRSDDGADLMTFEINCVKWTVDGHPAIRTCYPSAIS